MNSAPITLIRDVVERARNGDQIARALLAETAHRAERGDPRCAANYRKFRVYIRKHPPKPRYSSFGVDRPTVLTRGLQVRIAGRHLADMYNLQSINGKPNAVVRRIAAGFSGEEHAIFCTAALKKRPVYTGCQAGFSGSVVSYAIRLQRVRMGGPISLISRRAAAELS